MITITIVKQVKNGKQVLYERKMKLLHSMDKARKEIIPIVKEMKSSKAEKREPAMRIDGVSYDTNSEKSLLLELGAIVSVDNELNEG